ncbi:MAG: sulfurtransferase-like selenium metabolism protein YedF [Clostridiales bacterium]|nr:sulfurtransferase-like selenium metabolism protein YedF [Clostridiales bacterium]MCF8021449.1 sulfurtransferase-like selenium metabolism protein YedF [Clostridiales bacterium]
MMTRDIDCRGLNCPHPVINTKKALEENKTGSITVIVDNETARQNVSLFVQNAGHSIEEREENGSFYITINKTEEKDNETKKTPVEGSLPANPIYFISTNLLGQGSPDLGAVLMKSLMQTITECNPSPEALVFMNSGVYLCCEGSEVLPYLKKMSGAGVKIFACGTCLDYYKLKGKLSVGTISNMFEINNELIRPNKVITIG